MSLNAEIEKARKEIVSDGYEMSLGEVINLYKEGELRINPEFQRLFRWDNVRKTRFIESILLSIPIPPVFVFQNNLGNWELIDGLQRLSTILEFTGNLLSEDGEKVPPSTLEGTNFLPSLQDMRWQIWNEGDKAIDKPLQLQIRRARIRVEILLKESDENAKYELFQRLNTGGANLSEQEVRNCVAFMINSNFYGLLKRLALNDHFIETTQQTDVAIEKQAGVELVLRLLAFRNHPYEKGLDVHEYLDKALVKMAQNENIDWKYEESVFTKTFAILNRVFGKDAFKKWNGNAFKGKFLMSLYETIAYGVSENVSSIVKMDAKVQSDFLTERSKALWVDDDFIKNSGAGVRGTTRLAKLLPSAKIHFAP